MGSPHPYGRQHRKERARAIDVMREGMPCPLCGLPMYKEMGSRLHYDHVDPVAISGGRGPKRLTHGWCNEARGTRLRNALARARKGQPPAPVRVWVSTPPRIQRRSA